MDDTPENPIASRVRTERAGLGWSQAKLAAAAGTTQQTIDRIERGLTTHSRAIPQIMEAFQKEWKTRSRTLDRVKGAAAKTRAFNSPIPTDEHSFPVLALSSDGSVDLVYYSQISSVWVETPASYALLVISDALQPTFQDGDLLYVSIGQAPTPGGFFVAFEYHPTDSQGPSVPPVQVYKLTAETETHYRCQTTASRAIELDKSLWHVDAIVSRYTPLVGSIHQPF